MASIKQFMFQASPEHEYTAVAFTYIRCEIWCNLVALATEPSPSDSLKYPAVLTDLMGYSMSIPLFFTFISPPQILNMNMAYESSLTASSGVYIM